MIPKKDDTEQRTLIAIMLSLVVFWFWSSYFAPPPPEPVPPSPEPLAQEGAPTAPPPVVEAVPARSLGVETAKFRGQLSSDGGVLRDIQLPEQPGAMQVTPVWTWLIGKVTGKSGPWKPYGDEPGPEQLLSKDASLLSAGFGPFTEADWLVEGEGPWTTTLVRPDGLVITRTWRQTDDPSRLQVDLAFENRGSTPLTGDLWVGTIERCQEQTSQYLSVDQPTALVDGDLEILSDLEDADEAPQRYEGPVSWFGVGDHYFLAAAIPSDPAWGTLTFAKAEADRYGAFLVRSTTLNPGASTSLALEVYLGGKDLATLSAIGHDLDKSIDLGVFGFFAKILLFIMQYIHKLAGNWGVAIILLTVLVKALFWPLTKASFVSGRKMQALAPKLNEIREKHKDDQQAAGMAQMQLFQQEGVSPLSGCLPMLVQMPVWFALYSVLQYSSDIYHADFLYLKDLSSVDPYGLLPTLVAILMMLQQRLTPISPGMDPLQVKMLRAMPLIFAVMMYAFPSGLSLYILVNTSLSIAQMWMINRSIPVATPATS